MAGSLAYLLAFEHQQQQRPPSIPCGPAGPGTLLGEKSSLFFNLVLHSCARVSLFTFTWLKISVKRGKEQVKEQLPIIPQRRKGRTCTEQLPLPALCWVFARVPQSTGQLGEQAPSHRTEEKAKAQPAGAPCARSNSFQAQCLRPVQMRGLPPLCCCTPASVSWVKHCCVYEPVTVLMSWWFLLGLKTHIPLW